MKGFTRDHKFVPMTDYKKVRKSRDPELKPQGVRLKRTTRVKAVNLVPTELLNHPMFEEGSEWLDILAENPKVIVPDKKQNVFWIWFGGESRNFHEVQPNGHTADTFSYGGDRATENITPKEAVKIIDELELNPEKVRKKRTELDAETRKNLEFEKKFHEEKVRDFTKELKKLIKDPDFMSSKSGVWGYTDKRIFLSTYGEGSRFNQTPEDRKNRVLHFSSASMAIGTDVSMDALVEAKDDAVESNLLNRNSSVSDLLDVSVIQVDQDISNRPLFLKLAKRSYLIGKTVLVK